MSAMANMRIGKRLMLGFGALTVLMLVMTGVSIWAQNALSEMDEATLQSETQVYLAARAQRDVDLLGRHLGVALLSRDKAFRQDRLEMVQTARENYKARIDELLALKPSPQIMSSANAINS